MLYLLILGMIMGLLAVVLLLTRHDLMIGDFFSIDSYINSAKVLTAERYNGISLGLSILASISVAYTGVLIGGMVLGLTKKKIYRVFSFLLLIPIALFTLLYTARAILLFALLLFFSSYMASRYFFLGDQFRLFTRKKVISGIVCIILVPALFLITQTARMNIHDFSLENFKGVADHLRVWFFGNVSAFSVWFDKEIDYFSPLYGKYTFGGIYEKISGTKREMGIFSDLVVINDQGTVTNVYTVFRSLLEDYTLPGVYVISFCLGIFSSWCTKRLLQHDLFSIGILSVIYGFLSWSIIGSCFVYNSVIFRIFDVYFNFGTYSDF